MHQATHNEPRVRITVVYIVLLLSEAVLIKDCYRKIYSEVVPITNRC
jgi:hypothetical protein